jgi:hypothetical protein
MTGAKRLEPAGVGHHLTYITAVAKGIAGIEQANALEPTALLGADARAAGWLLASDAGARAFACEVRGPAGWVAGWGLFNDVHVGYSSARREAIAAHAAAALGARVLPPTPGSLWLMYGDNDALQRALSRMRSASGDAFINAAVSNIYDLARACDATVVPVHDPRESPTIIVVDALTAAPSLSAAAATYRQLRGAGAVVVDCTAVVDGGGLA